MDKLPGRLPDSPNVPPREPLGQIVGIKEMIPHVLYTSLSCLLGGDCDYRRRPATRRLLLRRRRGRRGRR